MRFRNRSAGWDPRAEINARLPRRSCFCASQSVTPLDAFSAIATHTGGVTPEPKTCKSCGRTIEWRKKWEKNWPEIAYCCAACRSRKVTGVDRELEGAIRGLLAARAATATICPSEAARLVDAERWRELMEPARRAARRLVAQGAVEITQGGKVVDPSTAKGPIRVRKKPE